MRERDLIGYLFKFSEFGMSPQSFQVIESVDVIQSVAMICLRHCPSLAAL